MKIKILLPFAISFILLPFINFAQSQSRRAFAVTGETQGNFIWNTIRQIDLSTGSVIRNIYLPSTDKAQFLNASTGNAIAPLAVSTNTTDGLLQNMIAATAYDVKNNRLYFTHMQDTKLAYFDLNSSTPKIYYVESQPLKSFQVLPGEDDNITRMTFAADGCGYALTNNGNHLIKFTTGTQITITDLGSLKDAIANVDNSVHKYHDNWGGDMIGDAFGNLLLITVKGNIFKIDPSSLITTYIGTIKNLPENYSVNAAVVDADGSVVVSSAIDFSNYYRFDLASLQAVAVSNKTNTVFNASDFANENLAYQKEANAKKNSLLINKTVEIFPNPVKYKNFTLSFNNFTKGEQNIEITTISGKNILAKNIDATAKTQSVNLPNDVLPGMYIVKILDNGKTVYTNKIVVE